MIFLEIFLEASLVAFLEALDLEALNLKALVVLDLKALEVLVALIDLKALMVVVKRVLAIEEGGYITITMKYDISKRGCYCAVN